MLETLQSAQQDKADFLEALELDTDADGEVDVEAGDATGDNVASAASAAATALSDHVANLSGSEVTSVAASAAGWESGDSLNVLEGRLEDAQETLATANDNAADEDGLPNAIDSLEAAQAAYQTAITAEGKAETALNAEVAKYNELNSGASGFSAVSAVSDLSDLSEGEAVVQATASTPIIVLGENGALEAASGVTTADYEGWDSLLAEAQDAYDAEVAMAEAQSGFETAIANVLDIEASGWDTFTIDSTFAGSINNTVSGGDTISQLAVNSAGELYGVVNGGTASASIDTGDAIYEVSDVSVTTSGDLNVTLGSVVTNSASAGDVSAYTDLGASGSYDVLDQEEYAIADGSYYAVTSGQVSLGNSFDSAASVTESVLTAQENVETLQTLISDREELLADKEQADQLVTELGDLNDAISAAETALDDEGYVVESIDASAEAGTTDSDIFLLGDTDSAISNFELTTDEEAGDSIYVGNQLDVVVAGEDQDISDDLGSASANEAIVIDDGANTTIYFEDKAFAGNGSTDADMTSIELTGVTGADVSINSDGFLTVA